MEQSSFFNAEKTANGTYDRTYNAEDWAAYFATFVGNGVSCTPDTNLQVESSSGMNVIVNSGVAFINGYRYENTTPLTVQINQANSTYDRITSIILELNLNNRNIICTTFDGTAEPNPQPPSLTRTDSIYQLQLATVYVPAGATAIGTITDTRENSEVCGYMQMLAPTIPPAFLANLTLQGTIKNDATIIGGTYKNSCVEDTGINSCGISDSTLSGSIGNKGTINNYGKINGGTVSNTTLDNVNLTGNVNNFTTITGGTYNNPTLSGNVEVNNSGAQQALIDYYSGTHTQLVAPNVTGKCTISWWLIKAPLLSGQSINGSIGVLTMSITLDSTYNWSNNNRQEIDISQLPTSSARTITPTPYFQVGTSQGVLWLAGSNLTLEAGKTYTTKALMWQ